MTKTSTNKKLISLKRQPLVLLIFSSISFLLILFRLIFLQLLNYESFKKMSDENRIRLIASQPIRGRILDKNGYVLADSRVKYSLIMKPQSVKKNNWEKHKSSISNLLNIDINFIQKQYLNKFIFLIKTSSNKKRIPLKRQPLVLLIFSSISFLLILFRLIFLQLLNYESFKKMSDENRIRLIASQPILSLIHI